MSIDTSKLWMISVQDNEDIRWIRSSFNDEDCLRAFTNRYLRVDPIGWTVFNWV